MRTLLDVLNSISQTFHQNQIENARRQAEELLCDVFSYKRLQLYLNYEQPIHEPEWDRCHAWALRRIQGEPLAYIHGSVEFYHCPLKVTRDVLIPRPETEILVDKIAKEISKESHEGKKLLDLCCGSGCIGIALKKKLPQLAVILSDKSEKALQIAQQNATLNQIDVNFFAGDLLETLQGQKFDYLVCNPPYISEQEYFKLDADVRHFEPAQALVAGPTGLEFYEKLAMSLPHYLTSRAKVWFEIGYDQGDQVKEIFSTHDWLYQRVENDWAGHNRFFSTSAST